MVAVLDDRTSLGNTHVADRHHLHRRALRTPRREYIKNFIFAASNQVLDLGAALNPSKMLEWQQFCSTVMHGSCFF